MSTTDRLRLCIAENRRSLIHLRRAADLAARAAIPDVQQTLLSLHRKLKAETDGLEEYVRSMSAGCAVKP